MEKIISEQSRYIALLEGGKPGQMTRRNSMLPHAAAKENPLLRANPCGRIEDIMKQLDGKMAKLA